MTDTLHIYFCITVNYAQTGYGIARLSFSFTFLMRRANAKDYEQTHARIRAAFHTPASTLPQPVLTSAHNKTGQVFQAPYADTSPTATVSLYILQISRRLHAGGRTQYAVFSLDADALYALERMNSGRPTRAVSVRGDMYNSIDELHTGAVSAETLDSIAKRASRTNRHYTWTPVTAGALSLYYSPLTAFGSATLVINEEPNSDPPRFSEPIPSEYVRVLHLEQGRARVAASTTGVVRMDV